MSARLLLDHESRLSEGDHAALRLWLRLFTCTLTIERAIRARLRERFGTSLARFDLMAQLGRAPEGLRMNELSRRLMVTGGNITGLTSQLVAEGLVTRTPAQADRRVHVIVLTAKGRRAFLRMASAHELWIAELMSGLPAEEFDALYRALGRLKARVAAQAVQAQGKAA